MPAIFAFLNALPALISLIGRLADLFNRLLKWSHENGVEAWITNLEASIDKLERAKTAEEKLDAAQSLVSSIRNV